MDKMNQNNDPLKNVAKREDIWKDIGFFSAGNGFVFVQKKTEKIIAALYLVSDLFKDSEPLKWELREKGICLLSACFSLNTSDPVDKSSAAQTIFETSLETISHLRVAALASLISKMNHEIIVAELELLIDTLYACIAEEKRQSGYVLSHAFFDVDQNIESPHSTPQNLTNTSPFQRQKDVSQPNPTSQRQSHPSSSKGHSIPSTMGAQNKGQFNPQKDSGITKVALSDNPKNPTNALGASTGPVEVKRQNRRQTIIDLFKGQESLTIKDCAAVIKDCSEKTIQRELLELVDLGILKKEGERRWSRYSLNA